MRRFFVFVAGIFTLLHLYAQDFDIYSRLKDDMMNFDKMPSSMQLNEYRVLQRNIRLQDAMNAILVPGYVHFKADEKKTGYWLLALRVAGYMVLSAVYVSSKAKGEPLLNINPLNNSNEDEINIAGQWKVDESDVISTLSATIIVFTYFYDWIHGKAKLESKQELIRYKYNLKMALEKEIKSGRVVPSVGVSVKF
jgi:hypothetical protein